MLTKQYFKILPKGRLHDFVRDIDPNLVLEDEVEEFLLNYVDQFIDRIVNGACILSKHRQENTIDVKDFQQYLGMCICLYYMFLNFVL